MKEEKLLKQVNEICIESLDPDAFEKWNDVKKVLISTRKNLKHLSSDSKKKA